jgi:hypothetical protein
MSVRPGLTWLSPHGEFVRSERFSMHEIAPVPCRVLGFWDLLGDGSLVAALNDNFHMAFCPPIPPSPWRETGLIVRSTDYDGRLDTLGLLPSAERNSPNYRVYGKHLVLAYGPDRVFAGDTGAEGILVLSFEGDTLGVLPTPFDAEPVPRRAKRQERRRLIQADGSEMVGKAYLYPETFPRFGRLVADETGFLWVMAYPELAEPGLSGLVGSNYLGMFVTGVGGDRWRVLDIEGEVVFELRTRFGFFPLEIGADYILGISKDELDVQSVELYALSRSSR